MACLTPDCYSPTSHDSFLTLVCDLTSYHVSHTTSDNSYDKIPDRSLASLGTSLGQVSDVPDMYQTSFGFNLFDVTSRARAPPISPRRTHHPPHLSPLDHIRLAVRHGGDIVYQRDASPSREAHRFHDPTVGTRRTIALLCTPMEVGGGDGDRWWSMWRGPRGEKALWGADSGRKGGEGSVEGLVVGGEGRGLLGVAGGWGKEERREVGGRGRRRRGYNMMGREGGRRGAYALAETR